MFEYNVFDKINISLAKRKFARKILAEINDLSLEEKIKHCEKLKSQLEEDREKYLALVQQKQDERDEKEKAWMDNYATGSKRDDAFDAGDYAESENKELDKAVKTLCKCDGAIIACEKILQKLNNLQTKSASQKR